MKTMGFEVADDDWDDAALTDAVVRAEVDAKASIASMTAAAPLMDRVNASVDSVAGRDSRGAPAKPAAFDGANFDDDAPGAAAARVYGAP